MRSHALLLAFVMGCTPVFPSGSLVMLAQKAAPLTSTQDREALHNSADWALIASHLPDPATATVEKLVTAGDVLRARRFPHDALDYYGYAMARGGDVTALLNKMGILRLELRQNDLAHELFLRIVRTHKKDATAWNNLAVTDYASQRYRAAVDEYKRACKLDKHSAIFRANLGLAYFELGDASQARKEFAEALKLDPTIMTARDGGGSTAHILGAHNYPGMCLEMAKLYAQQNQPETMLYWLAKGSDAGLDVLEAVRDHPALGAYRKDPRVLLLIANSAQLHGRAVAADKPPSLGTAQQPQ
ncbi:MAG TPA: tetratricopeptide repeat protein [Acidobacteriaceae bacterium]|jgi:tetratricopeptide (TPR) repeat protein|nr:tetratricopeptide repeat protein [Acidobacteriaceae bacterium]